MECMVADVIQETPDTTTLVLFTGNEKLDYRPGHFLTIDPHQFPALERFTGYLEDVKGHKEKPRAYSLTSAPDEKYLAITVKAELYVSGATKFPPLLSPLLVWRTPRGTRMTITGFTGPYVLPEDQESRANHIYHICAGSGVVPNYSMIKHALAHHSKLRHTLIFTNKTWEDVIFRGELEKLAARHAGRLRVFHTLTREKDDSIFDAHVRKGRVTAELLQELVPDADQSEFFVCGPAVTGPERKAAREKGEEPRPRFMETVLGLLDGLGVDKSRIRRESYG